MGAIRKHLTKDQVKNVRDEYSNNASATIEFLADKYDMSAGGIDKILRNITHHDPGYERTKKKSGGNKKGIFLPDHIREAKDLLTPTPTTAHRARGQNRTINRFK